MHVVLLSNIHLFSLNDSALPVVLNLVGSEALDHPLAVQLRSPRWSMLRADALQR